MPTRTRHHRPLHRGICRGHLIRLLRIRRICRVPIGATKATGPRSLAQYWILRPRRRTGIRLMSRDRRSFPVPHCRRRTSRSGLHLSQCRDRLVMFILPSAIRTPRITFMAARRGRVVEMVRISGCLYCRMSCTDYVLFLSCYVICGCLWFRCFFPDYNIILAHNDRNAIHTHKIVTFAIKTHNRINRRT